MIETDGRGRRLNDNNLLLLLNAHHEDIAFMLPEFDEHDYWDALLDTFNSTGTPESSRYKSDKAIPCTDGHWCC